MSYYGKHQNCKMCGKELDRWSRAETCSDACRKQWSRRKGVITRSYQNTMRELGALRRCLKEYPDLRPDTVASLKALRIEITDILRLFDQEVMQEQAAKDEMLASLQNKRGM